MRGSVNRRIVSVQLAGPRLGRWTEDLDRLLARNADAPARERMTLIRIFKGACGRGVYDNMKTAVETIFVGKDRQYNRRFLQICLHRLVEPVACTPASGWEKARSRTKPRPRWRLIS